MEALAEGLEGRPYRPEVLATSARPAPRTEPTTSSHRNTRVGLPGTFPAVSHAPSLLGPFRDSHALLLRDPGRNSEPIKELVSKTMSACVAAV